MMIFGILKSKSLKLQTKELCYKQFSLEEYFSKLTKPQFYHGNVNCKCVRFMYSTLKGYLLYEVDYSIK